MRDQSPVVGGTLFALESFFRRVKWSARAASRPAGPRGTWTQARADFWAGFLDECLGDMSHTMPGLIAEILTMLPFGWSYFEVVYKYRRGPEEEDARYRSRYGDNRLGWRKMSLRPQNTLSRWALDGDGGIQGMYQSTPRGEVLLPIDRCLHFRTTEGSNPEGRSLLRNARRAYYFRKRLEELEAIGVERNLAGIPKIEVPAKYLAATATEDEKAFVAFMVEQGKSLRRDEAAVLVVPSQTYIETVFDPQTRTSKPVQLNTGYKFDTIGSPGKSEDVNAMITRYKRDEAMSMLASFLMLGADGTGSLALSEDLTDLFELAGSGVLDGIAATLNRFAVTRLMQVNGVPPELWPTLEHGGLSDAALRHLIDTVNSLLGSGAVTPDPVLEGEMRDRTNLPPKPEPQVQAEGGDDTASTANPAPPPEAAAARIDYHF